MRPAPRMPTGWRTEAVDGSTTAILARGVGCRPLRILVPGRSAASHGKLAITQLEVSAASSAALLALAARLSVEAGAHTADPTQRMLRWVSVQRAQDAALTTASVLVLHPTSTRADLLVATARGDMTVDPDAAASSELVRVMAATLLETA